MRSPVIARWLALAILPLLAEAAKAAPALTTGISRLHGESGFGPHPVGYRFVELRDAARSGSRAPGSARVVRLQLWYPAKEDGEAMRFADYDMDVDFGPRATRAESDVMAIERLTADYVSAGTTADDARVLLAEPVAARRDATPRAPARALLLAPGLDPLLAEYLASCGYAVVRANSLRWGFGFSDELEDLALAAREASSQLSFVEARPVVLGFSRFALLAFEYAMRDLDVAAVVSFDGVEIWKSWRGRAIELPWFEPELLSLPVLRFDDPGHAADDLARDEFYGRAPAIDLHEIALAGIRHADLTLGLRPLVARGLTATPDERLIALQRTVRTALADFLDRVTASRGFDDGSPALAAIAGDPAARARYTRRAPLAPPLPTTEEAMDLVESAGAKALLVRLAPALALPGFRLPSRYWSETFSAAFARNDLDGAAELARVFATQYPTSVAPHYFEGLLLRRRGDLSGAAAAFRRAIERGGVENPDESMLTRSSLVVRARRALTPIETELAARPAEPSK